MAHAIVGLARKKYAWQEADIAAFDLKAAWRQNLPHEGVLVFSLKAFH